MLFTDGTILDRLYHFPFLQFHVGSFSLLPTITINAINSWFWFGNWWVGIWDLGPGPIKFKPNTFAIQKAHTIATTLLGSAQPRRLLTSRSTLQCHVFSLNLPPALICSGMYGFIGNYLQNKTGKNIMFHFQLSSGERHCRTSAS